MEMTLIELLGAWASRNPLLPLLLFGPIALAVVWVLIDAWRGAPPPSDSVDFETEIPEPIDSSAASRAPEPQPSAEVAAIPEPGVTTAEVAEPVEPAESVEPVEATEPPRPARLRDRLRLTRESLGGRLGGLLGGRSVDDALLEDLEQLLFEADLGVKTADSLLAKVRDEAGGGDENAVRRVLREAILEKLRRVEVGGHAAPSAAPHVILVLGVNGAGKTTTIGKLAARYQAAGQKVILGAGDTFRAAAIEQLQAWGERAGCEVIAGREGADPSSVAFDTVKAAKSRGIAVAIIDSAGRLQTKRPLMEELGKIVRVIGKSHGGAPHEVLLVLDATTGQNALSQARLFTEVAGVTGLVLTKLDGTAKGGVLIGLADEFGIPVKYVGVGEAVEDLRDFSADEFVEAVFENGSPN